MLHYTCVHARAQRHICLHVYLGQVQSPQDSLPEFTLSSHHVYPRDQTQVVRLGLYLLSRLAGPDIINFYQSKTFFVDNFKSHELQRIFQDVGRILAFLKDKGLVILYGYCSLCR